MARLIDGDMGQHVRLAGQLRCASGLARAIRSPRVATGPRLFFPFLGRGRAEAFDLDPRDRISEQLLDRRDMPGIARRGQREERPRVLPQPVRRAVHGTLGMDRTSN
jgi:hypothetical protein